MAILKEMITELMQKFFQLFNLMVESEGVTKDEQASQNKIEIDL